MTDAVLKSAHLVFTFSSRLIRSPSAAGIDFEFGLAMAAGRRPRIGRKAKTVEDRAQCQYCHEQDSEMEVAELWHRRRVTVRMRDQAQRDRADGDTHPQAELHDRTEKAIGPAHPVWRDLRVGERRQTGELHRAAGSMTEKDDQDEGNRCGRAKRSAKSHRDGCDDSVDDDDLAKAKSAQDLDDEGFHAEIAREECKQIEPGLEGAEAEGDLEHERQKKRQHGDGDAEDARSINGERIGFELHGFDIDERGGRIPTRDDDGKATAEQAERKDKRRALPVDSFSAQLLHRIDSSGRGKASQDEGEPVEGVLLVESDVFNPEQSQDESYDPEWKIEKKIQCQLA